MLETSVKYKRSVFANFFLSSGAFVTLGIMLSAIEGEDLATIKVVCEGDLSRSDSTLILTAAARGGNLEITKYFYSRFKFKKGIDFLFQDIFHFSAMKGNLDIFKFFVECLEKEKKIEILETRSNILASTAAEHGRLEMLKYFRSRNWSFDKHPHLSEIPIVVASKKGKLEVVKFLAEECSVDLNFSKWENMTPIFFASSEGHFEVVKYLASKGAKLDEQTTDSLTTALSTAVWHGFFKIVKCLVEFGAKLDIVDRTQISPLLHSVNQSQFEIAKFLVEKGANVNLKDSSGESALYSAVIRGNLELVKLLVEKGANINSTNYDQKTPAWAAAYHNRSEILKFLVENGADLTIATKSSNKTPRDVANWRGNWEIEKYLKEK